MGSELSLPYVPIDPRIDEHPKTRKFLRLIGLADDPNAYLIIVGFLMKVGKLHPDGNLGNLDPEEVADMARWKGDPKVFAAALCDSGWLKFGNGGYVVVEWSDHGGQVYAKREEFRERQRSAANKRWNNDAPGHAGPMPDDANHENQHARNAEGEGEVNKEESGKKPDAPPSPKKRRNEPTPEMLEVMEHWRKVHPEYVCDFPKDTVDRLRARTKSYSTDALKAAIDAHAVDKKYIETNNMLPKSVFLDDERVLYFTRKKPSSAPNYRTMTDADRAEMDKYL